VQQQRVSRFSNDDGKFRRAADVDTPVSFSDSCGLMLVVCSDIATGRLSGSVN